MSLFPKHAMVYRSHPNFSLDMDKFESQLKEFEFTPCNETYRSKFGWYPALGKKGDTLFHTADGHILICARKEVKEIPNAVINESMNEKVAIMEDTEGRPLKKREKDAIKDQIVTNLIPRAFSKHSYARIYINPADNLMFVDCSSTKFAEDALALLRKTIGSLPVVPAVPEIAIEASLTKWVSTGELPAGFNFCEDIKLVSIIKDGGAATFKRQDIGSDEIQACIKADKMVVETKMVWQDRIAFTISEKGTIKNLKFSDKLLDQNEDIPREDELARMDADFCLATGEMKTFLNNLYEVLGGLPVQDDEVKATQKEKVTVTVNSEESDDVLLDQCRAHILTTGRASASNIQRQFKIGYNRAARILEQLVNEGAIAENAHNGTYSILVDSAEEAE